MISAPWRSDGSVWLSQAQIAELFGTTVPNANIHIRNIVKEGELAPEAVFKESLITADRADDTLVSFVPMDAVGEQGEIDVSQQAAGALICKGRGPGALWKKR